MTAVSWTVGIGTGRDHDADREVGAFVVTFYVTRQTIACDTAQQSKLKDGSKEKPKISLASFKAHTTRDSLWVTVDSEVWE